MKLGINTSYILLALSVFGASVASAKGSVQLRSAASVRCIVRNVEVASDDVGVDRKKAKTLTVYSKGRVLAQTMSLNSERIEFLDQQCEAATGGRGLVKVDVLTAEVTPQGGFTKSRGLAPVQAEVAVKLLSQHKFQPSKHRPGNL